MRITLRPRAVTAGTAVFAALGLGAAAYLLAPAVGGGSAGTDGVIRRMAIHAVISGDLLADSGAHVVVTAENTTGSTLRWQATETELKPHVVVTAADGVTPMPTCPSDKWDFAWDTDPVGPIAVGPHQTVPLGAGSVGLGPQFDARGCSNALVTLTW